MTLQVKELKGFEKLFQFPFVCIINVETLSLTIWVKLFSCFNLYRHVTLHMLEQEFDNCSGELKPWYLK